MGKGKLNFLLAGKRCRNSSPVPSAAVGLKAAEAENIRIEHGSAIGQAAETIVGPARNASLAKVPHIHTISK